MPTTCYQQKLILLLYRYYCWMMEKKLHHLTYIKPCNVRFRDSLYQLLQDFFHQQYQTLLNETQSFRITDHFDRAIWTPTRKPNNWTIRSTLATGFLKKNSWQVFTQKKTLNNRGNVLLQQTRCVTLFDEIASGEVAYQKVKKIL